MSTPVGVTTPETTPPSPGDAVCSHHLQTYDPKNPAEVGVAGFLAVSLLRGEGALVVATPSRHRAILQGLQDVGVNTDYVIGTGHYVALDAEKTLRAFYGPDGIDEESFHRVLSSHTISLTERYGAVSVYGEMVGVLLVKNDLAGALELEKLWERELIGSSARLVCGYPQSALPGPDPTWRAIEELHHSPLPLAQRVRAYDLGVSPDASRTARGLLEITCERWGGLDREWLDALKLVVSELVGNALRHTDTGITLSVESCDHLMRLSVVDGDPGLPQPREVNPTSESGRGFLIIEELSQSWGVERLPRGKRIWVEIPPQ